MLLAYLEGVSSNIVTASYVYGLRSIYREHLLLDAVHRKVLAKQLLHSAHYDTQFIPSIKLESLPDFASNLRKQVNWLNKILLMELDAQPPQVAENKAKNLVKIYNTLEKSGILSEVATST